MLACINNHDDIVDLLLNNNPDLSITDIYGNNVIFHCSQLDVETIRKIAKKLDVNK